MRTLQKLVKNGHSIGFNIPKQVLLELGWIPGQALILEKTDRNELVLRRPNQSDFLAPLRCRVVFDALESR